MNPQSRTAPSRPCPEPLSSRRPPARSLRPLRSIAYFAAYAASRILPRRAGFLVADLASFWAHALKRKERQGVENNLAVVAGQDPRSEGVRSAVGRLYRNFGRACAELLYEVRDRKPDETVLPGLRLEGLDLLDRALAQRCGVILSTAHLGNWELGALALSSRGYPVTALAASPAAGASGLYGRYRDRFGLKVMNAADSAHRCVSVLRRGGILGIVSDRRFGSAGLRVEFFGRPTLLPQGAARLCVLTGAPILVASFRPGIQEGCEAVFRVDARIDAVPGMGVEDGVLRTQQRLAQALESVISRSPEEWYCFEDLWPSRGETSS